MAALLVAFVCGSVLSLWLTPVVAHDDAWYDSHQPFDRATAHARSNVHLRKGMDAEERSEAIHSAAEENAVLKALTAMEQRLASVDRRLADTEHSVSAAAVRQVTPPPAPPPAADAQMATQVAALSQTVAAVLSLVASEHQKSGVAPAPSPIVVNVPAAASPQPAQNQESSWDRQQKLDEIKRDVSKKAEEAAKALVDPEIKKLKDTIKRLENQNSNRYTQVLGDLAKLAPGGSTQGLEEWPAQTKVNNTVATPEQAAGHACRSPPCSRDTESCKYNGNCCADRMYEMLSDFSDFLTSRNVTHFLVAGTLLGAIRDKDIIPFTSDIDILIPREGWERAKEINFIKGRKRSYYFMADPQEHHCARLCAVWEGLPVNRHSFSSEFEWDTEKLGADIQYYMDIYDEGMDFATKMKHLHYPLSTVIIRNRTFPAPHEQELWVEAKYGSSWRTPDNQAHGGRVPYPTLDEAKTWSESMLMLRKARTDAVLGHRLLERATVDHKTGHIEVQDAGQEMQAPDVEAKRVTVEGLRVSAEGNVTNGSVVIFPPDAHEGQITNYILYWAAERVQGWDLTLEQLGKKIMSVSRCSTGGDPFKACAQRGVPLHAPLPLNVQVPSAATHLVVASANEAGSGTKSQSAALADAIPGGSDAMFTRRSMLGILGGLASDSPALASCVAGTAAIIRYGTSTSAGMTSSIAPQLEAGWRQGESETKEESTPAPAPILLLKSKLEDQVVAKMLKKTPDDMQAALRVLADWLQPVEAMLKTCNEKAAKGAHDSLVRALGHIRAPKKFNYQPGKALDIDDTSIFLGINHAIGELRKDKPAQFGSALGEFLKPLGVAPAEKFYETKEDQHWQVPSSEYVCEHGGLHALGSTKYFAVSVKAAHDAHIALFSQEVSPGVVPDNTSVLYEFVIGSSLNKLCAIRFSKSGKNEAEVDVDDALDGNQFRDFWVSADTKTGRVAIGRGQNISANLILNMTDAPPGVRGTALGFAVMTPATFGSWRFPEAEQDAIVTSTSEVPVIETSSTGGPPVPVLQPHEKVVMPPHLSQKARVVIPPASATKKPTHKGLEAPPAGADSTSSGDNRQSSNGISPPPSPAGSAADKMRKRLHGLGKRHEH